MSCHLERFLQLTGVGLVLLLSLSTQTLLPLQAAHVTQVSSTANVVSLPQVSAGAAISEVFTNSSSLGFELTPNIYDSSAAGYLVAHRTDVTRKVVFTFNDQARVNVLSHQLTFSDYGNAVLLGGRSANPTVNFYESKAFTPFTAIVNRNGTVSILYQPGNRVALNVPLSSLGAANDYFVIESLNDNGHVVIMIWGITQYGTYASGVWFDKEFSSLSSLRADAYVLHWRDVNGNGVADLMDSFDVTFSGVEHDPFSFSMPNPPTTVGCYSYGVQGWQSVGCMSQADVSKLDPPLVRSAGPLIEGGHFGVWGLVPDVNQQPPTGILNGGVQVWVWSFGGETDSAYGPGRYSIQVNTNFFPGADGQSDWVQFVYQRYGDYTELCVWEISNISPGPPDYHTNTQCYPSLLGVGVPVLPLTAGYAIEVRGLILKAFNELDVVALTQAGTFSVVAPDVLGLGTPWTCASCLPRGTTTTHWTAVSGTVLGVAKGSEADFLGGAKANEVETIVSMIQSCGTPCTPPNPIPVVFASTATAETNNLYYYSTPPWTAQPVTCLTGSGRRCNLDTDSIS